MSTSRNLTPLFPSTTFQNMMERFFNDASFPTLNEADFHLPATDISETEKSYTISAELPGIKKEDVKVSLHEGVLTIEAETKSESKEEKDKTLRRERRYGKFLRRFTLGPQADDKSVSAKFENGVLTLTIEKQATTEAVKPKAIPIS